MKDRSDDEHAAEDDDEGTAAASDEEDEAEAEPAASPTSGAAPSPSAKRPGTAAGGRAAQARAIGRLGRSAAAAKPETRPAARTAGRPANSQAILAAAIALVVGGAVGWQLHAARAKPDAGPSVAPAATSGTAPAGSTGPNGTCERWAATICSGAGEGSEACDQARSAQALLPASACREALGSVSATLAQLGEVRSVCKQLEDKLCADLGPETATCKMVREKTPGFPAKRCRDMLGGYDTVIAELRQLEAQTAPLSPEAAAAQRAGDGPAFGPANAKVAIVEYSDFQCPFCARAAATVKELEKRYGKVVRFVFRQYPLPMHSAAKLAAEASLAAHAQGRFWSYHDLLFANQDKLDRSALEDYAKQVKLDLGKFRQALDDHRFAEAVSADIALGDKINVGGTPTMIVGTARVGDPSDLEALSKLVDSQLASAGVPVPPAK